MTAVLDLATRPGPTEDASRKSRFQVVGFTLAFVGLMSAVASVVGNFVAAGGIDAQNSYSQTLAWTFGLSIFSFGVIKISIAIILMGIIVRLWFRVDAIKGALSVLHGHSDEAPPVVLGEIDTEWGKANVTTKPPKALQIHRMALTMWRPMLVMGAMVLAAGLVISLVAANNTAGTEEFRQAAALSQGTIFLGEALLLSAISFLLGAIMAGLREGGGEVQASLGLPVTTLKMPLIAKAFIGIMMVGLMVGIAQFVGYLFAFNVADQPDTFSRWLNWLGPFSELSLGIILAAVVLALINIGNVLAFQFGRVKSIIRTGV
ncbi:MAG: hypothetical protein ACC652_02390 [Acidimicrobiales bacterium]